MQKIGAADEAGDFVVRNQNSHSTLITLSSHLRIKKNKLVTRALYLKSRTKIEEVALGSSP